MSSAKVSFTYEELIRLRDLQSLAWGKHSKAWKKLNKAVEKLEGSETYITEESK
jgi:hypothetical protein